MLGELSGDPCRRECPDRSWMRSRGMLRRVGQRREREIGVVHHLDQILVERDGPLAIVAFNDPPRLNALNTRMRAAFTKAMDGLIADGAVRAILITGQGRAFCAGANLKNMSDEQKGGADPDVGGSLRDSVNPLLLRMAAAAKPIVSAVNGAAVGVGCGIALAADIVWWAVRPISSSPSSAWASCRTAAARGRSRGSPAGAGRPP